MMRLGGAKPGDKTMLDALGPFADHLERHTSDGLPNAWVGAVAVASSAARETADLTPQVGRARPLAERSVGTADPGATSFALAAAAVAKVLAP